jgi:parallel beta-helix repeat protein
MSRAALIAARLACFAAPLALALAPAAAGGAEKSCDLRVKPSEDLVAKVAAAPPSATICLARGEYRLTEPLRPKTGQTIEGDAGAALIGSERLSGFTSAGADTWDAHFVGELGPRSGECRVKTDNACQLPNAVFRDGKPLRRVMSRGSLAQGTFWIDASAAEVYVYGDPTGHSLEIALTPAAIVSGPEGAGADVTVRGLTVEMFATEAQHGAIDTSAPGWTIADDRVEENHGAGITTEGGARIEHDKAIENGEEGIAGTGVETVVIGNLIADNNWAEFDPGWEAGGAKWGYATDLLVRGNTVRDNKGPGLWADVDTAAASFEANTVTGNELAGIFYEISEDATIAGNTVRGNGFGMDTWLWGSGILIAASHGVAIRENTVSRNANAIGLVQQQRGVSERNGLPRVLHEITVENNVETLGSGATGLVQDDGDQGLFADPTITFSANTYSDYTSDAFFWDDRELEPAQWQAFGNDPEGTFKGS